MIKRRKPVFVFIFFHFLLFAGALGGRLDHTIAAINTLHMFPDLNIILFGDGNMVRHGPRFSPCVIIKCSLCSSHVLA